MVKKLVDKLKSIRLKKKITHEKLSLLTGLSQKHISNVENHKAVPSIETLQKLAFGLGVQIDLKVLEEQAS